jgi:hypothetical protein
VFSSTDDRKNSHRRTTQVSGNYGLYAAKMAELRAQRKARGPLHNQLQELLLFVMRCEMQWDSRTPR